MTPKEITQFAATNPAFFLATTEGTEPRVRGMLLYRADEKGFIFHTGTSKDLYRQLKTNPGVEMCFNSMSQGLQLRIRGRAEEVRDMKLKEEIVAARPFLKPWVEERGWDFLAVFRVTDCTAHTWTMETNLAPKEYIKLGF